MYYQFEWLTRTARSLFYRTPPHGRKQHAYKEPSDRRNLQIKSNSSNWLAFKFRPLSTSTLLRAPSHYTWAAWYARMGSYEWHACCYYTKACSLTRVLIKSLQSSVPPLVRGSNTPNATFHRVWEQRTVFLHPINYRWNYAGTFLENTHVFND